MTTQDRSGSSERGSPADLGTVLVDVGHGDHAAFAVLYDRTAAQVFGAVRQRFREKSVAEKVMLEVYRRMWRTAPRYDPDQDPQAWLLATVHRQTVEHLQ